MNLKPSQILFSLLSLPLLSFADQISSINSYAYVAQEKTLIVQTSANDGYKCYYQVVNPKIPLNNNFLPASCPSSSGDPAPMVISSAGGNTLAFSQSGSLYTLTSIGKDLNWSQIVNFPQYQDKIKQINNVEVALAPSISSGYFLSFVYTDKDGLNCAIDYFNPNDVDKPNKGWTVNYDPTLLPRPEQNCKNNLTYANGLPIAGAVSRINLKGETTSFGSLYFPYYEQDRTIIYWSTSPSYNIIPGRSLLQIDPSWKIVDLKAYDTQTSSLPNNLPDLFAFGDKGVYSINACDNCINRINFKAGQTYAKANGHPIPAVQLVNDDDIYVLAEDAKNYYTYDLHIGENHNYTFSTDNFEPVDKSQSQVLGLFVYRTAAKSDQDNLGKIIKMASDNKIYVSSEILQ